MAIIREKWSSRSAFIVAAIGAAIGFGNVWRFPYLAFEYGGGAFFIPYLMALFLIGIPILILEIAVGQYYQTGDAGAFGNINKSARGLGLTSVFCVFVLNCYYSAFLVWACRMFVYTFQGSQAGWRDDRVTNYSPSDWFKLVVTGAETVQDNFVPTRIVWQNVLALIFVWLFIFFCLVFGIKWTGRVAYFTVGIPALVIIVLLIRSASLDGAREGIIEYIGRWDVSQLRKRGDVWSRAVSQIFFSIGVTMGIMTAYASYNKRNSPVFTNSIIISLSNSFFSFVAGFAVFSILGYDAKRQGLNVKDLKNLDGVSLVFSTYPVALDTLQGSDHWERLLFVALFFLGVDSSFAFIEALTTVIQDTALFQHTRRSAVTGITCVAGFVCSLLYMTDAGLYFVDVTDFYINFMLLLVGLAECFVVGWIYGIEDQISKVGLAPVLSLLTTSCGSVIIASGVWFGIVNNNGSQPKGWSISDWSLMWGFIVLALCVTCGLLVTGYLASLERKGNGTASKLSTKVYICELLMGNMWHLRKELVGVVRYIPMIWFVFIKHVIPQILFILFVNLAASKVECENDVENKKLCGTPQFGNYGQYPPGYQALGITTVSIALLILVVGLIFPDVYACFSVKTYEDECNVDKESDISA